MQYLNLQETYLDAKDKRIRFSIKSVKNGIAKSHRNDIVQHESINWNLIWLSE